MPRRHDPGRRRRIIDAAVRVVSDKGLAGLSHRSVAAAADVPLGSTTYHFKTLDELVVAALRQVSAEWVAGIERLARRGLPGEAALADELARLLGRWLAGDRARLELEYELYLAALRREAVRPVAAEYLDAMTRVLRPYVADEATARAVVALVDGVLLQCLLTGRPYDREEVRTALSRVLTDEGAGL
ncbi:TetR/AcrR family transcriptional regulator [Streptomyces poonensis]|uniref:EbrA repressor n=1 Tax=Streptomyces poonensis TaxID=68255 RepID=A0A918Q675_9ACTN|nr:TetR family transcriptional regulator [Streptomyces poonensis]GGZ33460.1 ebrA repressor [Streptomyces poonensis]GLJ89165.1 ebrA repressor [Streptomyces poonensis]